MVTPSSLTVDEAARRVARQESTHSLAATIGSLAHRILEQWSFGDDTSGLLANCDRAVDSLPGHLGPEAEVMRAELKEMMTSFANSQPYAALCRARILGREVCFLMPWSQAGNGEPRRLMEGRIDVLYQEMNGQMWIADYKTDRIEECEMADRVAAYRLAWDVACSSFGSRARILATSTATLPTPITATDSASRVNAPESMSGWPQYQFTKSVAA